VDDKTRTLIFAAYRRLDDVYDFTPERLYVWKQGYLEHAQMVERGECSDRCMHLDSREVDQARGNNYGQVNRETYLCGLEAGHITTVLRRMEDERLAMAAVLGEPLRFRLRPGDAADLADDSGMRGVVLPESQVKKLLRAGEVTMWSPITRPTVGERLFVKETWQVATGHAEGDLGAAVRFRADGAILACWMPPENPIPLGVSWGNRWRASTVMPYWAARLTVQVVATHPDGSLRLQLVSNRQTQTEGEQT
jgi:hypothetical protein